jgi:hypothetical protein
MAKVSLSGSDSILINNRVLSDLADADCVNLEFGNEIAALKTGKNGNAIYSLNQSGNECEVTLRLIRGSSDDKFLNKLMSQQKTNFAGFVLMTGEFIKKIGDGAGKISNDTYIMSGGIFTKLLPAKNNTDGDSEQSVVIYTMKFANSPRVLS